MTSTSAVIMLRKNEQVFLWTYFDTPAGRQQVIESIAARAADKRFETFTHQDATKLVMRIKEGAVQ